MTERERMSSEELFGGLYDLIIRQKVAQFQAEDKTLTTEQATARAYKETPAAYSAYTERQRARWMKQQGT